MRLAVKPKRMVQLSLGAAGLVELVSLMDLASGVPYGRAVMMDSLTAVSAGIVIFLAISIYRDLT